LPTELIPANSRVSPESGEVVAEGAFAGGMKGDAFGPAGVAGGESAARAEPSPERAKVTNLRIHASDMGRDVGLFA
jgi:hypothetical protein